MNLILIAILSASCGSFLNMLIYRLNSKTSLLKPYFSKCPKCRHRLNFQDLLPIISYLLLKGRCRYCRKSIPLSYLLVEIFCLGFGLWGYFWHLSWLTVLLYMILVAIFFSDLKYQEIPYFFTASAAVLVLAQKQITEINPWNLLIILSFEGLIKILESFYYRREVFGGGDILLLAILALYFPLPKFILLFYLSFILGLLTALPLLIQGKVSLKTYLPFAPFIIISFFIIETLGTTLLQNYWKLFHV